VNPWAEFDRVADLLGSKLTASDRERLTSDGPAEATERLTAIARVLDIEVGPAGPAHSVAAAQQTSQTKASTQPTPRPKRARNVTGPVNAPGDYALKGGFFKVPNDVTDDLIATMSAPLLKAYLYAYRLARVDGTFWITYSTVAKKIGCTSPRHGRRVFVRLQTAGLVRVVNRGGAKAHKANEYQLVPLETLDLDAVRRTLAEPLTKKTKEVGAAAVLD
jgi:hypothetical protein